MITHFDYNTNFWDAYPEYSAAGVFKKLYKADKSKGKASSSRWMWAVVLINDIKSPYYNLPEEGEDNKIDLISEDIMGDEKKIRTEIGKYEELKTFFLKTEDSKARRAFRAIEKSLDDRGKFLDDTKYDLGVPNEKGYFVGGTAKLLDDMHKNTKSIFDQFFAIQADLEKEEETAKTKGDEMNSLSDTNAI